MTSDKPLDYKKEQKEFYRPSAKVPVIVNVPEMRFLMVDGKGNPNSSVEFQQALEALYGLSYCLKMSYKKNSVPEGYFPYVVAPLEGHWDLPPLPEGQQYEGPLDKEKLVWTVMIRQPEFLTPELFLQLREELAKKKSLPSLPKVRLESFREGLCCQILHIGSYDDEPASFHRMEKWVKEKGYRRIKKSHREIYLSDFRKVAPEKLKTVLRFQIKKNPD